MISGLIHVPRPAEPDAVDCLADTLSALIAGVAAGLVGDAVIVAPRGTQALEAVAEGSGAVLVTPGSGGNVWRVGAEAARREWVLCLEAGDIPREGWIRMLDRFAGTARTEEALGRLRRPHAALPVRIAARLESAIGAKRPRAGDLVRRDRLLAGPTFRPRLRPRRLLARLDRA